VNDLEHFARVAGDNLLRTWLEKEMQAVVKFLAAADGPALYRAQGKYKALEEILANLEKAKTLR
jgi:hypothetical protein